MTSLRTRSSDLRTGWGSRFSLALDLLLAASLLAACASPAVHPAQPAARVSLQALLRMTPSATAVSLLPGSPPHLSALHFVNAELGWTAGQGVILATTDGGTSWRRQYLGSADVTGFSFLSPTLGFAATSQGLLKTEDGRTWRPVPGPSLEQVEFFSPEAGWALSGGSQEFQRTLLATADGGATWRRLAIGPVAGACFFGVQVGIAALSAHAGQAVTVERTTDGGAHWHPVLSVQGAVPKELQCTPDGSAWLVAAGWASMSQQSYSVFRSADAGASWRVILANTTGNGPGPGSSAGVPAGPGSSPGPLAVVDRSTAVMAGTCVACNMGTASFSATTDGGAAWSPATHSVPLPTAFPAMLDMLSARVGWLLSTPSPGESQIQETTDGGATWRTLRLVGPSKPTAATAFANARVGYGIGQTGDPLAVLRTEDGGNIWRQVGQLPPHADGLYALGVAGRSRLFVSTLNSLVYASRDGGRSWLPVPVSVLPATDAFSFAGPDTGCATVGSPQEGLDFATRDGGQTWARAAMQGVPAAICAVSLRDPALAKAAMRLVDRLAPTNAGVPEFFLSTVATGGGSLWIAFSNTPHSRLYILAPGQAPRVVRWPDGTMSVSSLSPVNAREAYATTFDGRLMATRDAGAHWRQVP